MTQRLAHQSPLGERNPAAVAEATILSTSRSRKPCRTPASTSARSTVATESSRGDQLRQSVRGRIQGVVAAPGLAGTQPVELVRRAARP